jgi:hypothetical protein
MDIKQIAALLGGGQKQQADPGKQAILAALMARPQPEMAASPGMMPLDVTGPGGFVNSPMPVQPDVPSRGEQRAVGNPADPAMMDAEMDAMRQYQSDPRKARVNLGAITDAEARLGGLGAPTNNEIRGAGVGSMTDAEMNALREYQSAPGKGASAVEDVLRKQSEIRALTPDEGRAVGAPSTGSGEVIVQDPNSPVGMRSEVIPGSAAERELAAEQERNQTRQIYDDVYGAAVFDNIDRARQLAEDTWFTNGGVGNLLRNIGGTNANDMRNLITPILSAIGIDRLQSMREASATGASGFGSLQAAELDLLVNGLYSLEQSQREGQFLDNLDRVEQSLAILQYGPPPEGVSRTEWRDYHRAQRQGTPQATPQGAAGSPQPTHRFNPATGQIEAIQ